MSDLLELALIAYNNTPNSKIKLSPNEITFGKIEDETSPIIIEARVEEYHKEKELINRVIKEILENEKTHRTTHLNNNREVINIPPGKIYVKTHSRSKNKPKYKLAIYSEKSKRIVGKGKTTKIHPSQVKRSRKFENREFSVKGATGDDEARPSTSKPTTVSGGILQDS